MAKQKNSMPVERNEISAIEKLGLRMSSMINSPRAQERCSALVHRLDSDQDAEWDEVMDLIAQTDGVSMVFQNDGGVLLEWEPASEEDRVLGPGEVEALGGEASL